MLQPPGAVVGALVGAAVPVGAAVGAFVSVGAFVPVSWLVGAVVGAVVGRSPISNSYKLKLAHSNMTCQPLSLAFLVAVEVTNTGIPPKT